MLDTTTLFQSREQAGFRIEACLQNLTDISEEYRQDTGQTYFKGHADNLRVGVSEYGVRITGSLSKFFLGTNLYTMNRSDCRRAFEKLADTLNLPIQRAKVTRVDIGHNLITDYIPELYYPYLGQSNRYQRLTQPQSITYQNSLRSKKFYNKIAESKNKGVLIPEVYAGKNLLRFEVCYMKRLSKEFNHALVTPDILTEEAFYMGLVNRWCNEYEIINKIDLPKMDKSKMKTPTGFKQQLIAIAVHHVGQENLLNLIEEMKAEKRFSTERNYYRIREEIKASSIPPHTQEPELIQELNMKIAMVKDSYR